MRNCPNCNEPILGRTDKKYCSSYCKSSFHYQKSKEVESSIFKKIDSQLKLNRRLLKSFNKAGKATIRKIDLDEMGFNPHQITHWWKNKNGDVYLFCYEYGFLQRSEKGKQKYILIKWQKYMC